MAGSSIQTLERSLAAAASLRPLLLLGLANALLTIVQAALLAYGAAAWWQQGAAVSALWPCWFGFSVLAILRAVLIYSSGRLGFRRGCRLRAAVRALLLARIDRAGPVVLRQRPLGHWVSQLVHQVEILHDYQARYRPQQCLAMGLPLLFWLALALVEPLAGVILLLTTPWIPLFMVLVGQQAARASAANQTALNRLAGHFLNRLTALPTLRLFAQAEAEALSVDRAADQLRLETLKVLKIAFLSSAVLEFFTALSIALVAVYLGLSLLGYIDLAWGPWPLDLAVALYLLLLLPEFFLPLRELGAAHHARAEAEGAAGLLLETLAALPQHDTATPPAANVVDTTEPVGLSLEALRVQAADGALLLDGIDLQLEPGETLLLCGASGSGKTTLLETLLGFHAYQGRLCDHRGRALTAEQISWQGQDLDLIAGTLRANLAPGRADEDAALWAMLDVVELAAWVRQQPGQLDLDVGPGGRALSAGQRQRLLLARALLKPSGLLLLDEPTAALDRAGARRLVVRLRPLLAARSCIMVSHRAELLPLADRVAELECGRLQASAPSVLAESPL